MNVPQLPVHDIAENVRIVAVDGPTAGAATRRSLAADPPDIRLAAGADSPIGRIPADIGALGRRAVGMTMLRRSA